MNMLRVGATQTPKEIESMGMSLRESISEIENLTRLNYLFAISTADENARMLSYGSHA